MYDIILFDADGTLYDFDKSEALALSETLTWAGIPASDEIIHTYHVINDLEWKALERGETTRERLRTERFAKFLAAIGDDGARNEKTPLELADHYLERLSMKCIPFPEAEQTLADIFGRCDIYIITNGITAVQTRRFSESPLTKYVKKAYISEQIGADKPSRRYFDHVLSDIGISYEEAAGRALVVGDSLTSDIAGGVSAGIDTCWFNPMGKKPGNVSPKYTISSLCELEKIIFPCEVKY